MAPEGRALCRSRVVFLKKIPALTTCGYGRSWGISASQSLTSVSEQQPSSNEDIPSSSNLFELLQAEIG